MIIGGNVLPLDVNENRALSIVSRTALSISTSKNSFLSMCAVDQPGNSYLQICRQFFGNL